MGLVLPLAEVKVRGVYAKRRFTLFTMQQIEVLYVPIVLIVFQQPEDSLPFKKR